MFCKNCGAEIRPGTKFCTSCGSAVEAGNAGAATNMGGASGTQTVVGMPPQVGVPATTYVQGTRPREKGTTFLFASSLIFMVFFGIRVITGFLALGDWGDIKAAQGLPDDIYDIISEMYSSYIINVGIIVAAFVAILTFFIFVNKLRNGQGTAEQRVGFSKWLFRFSIIVLVLGLAYLISDIVILSQFGDFIDRAKNYAQIDQDVLSQMRSEVTGALVFDVVFIAFGIANLVKSLSLKRNLKRVN